MRNANKDKKVKLYLLISGFTLWALSFSGVFGSVGLLQAYRLSSVRRELTARVYALEKQKQKLQISVKALEQDAYAQELAIRDILGFVRENELVFEFRE